MVRVLYCSNLIVSQSQTLHDFPLVLFFPVDGFQLENLSWMVHRSISMLELSQTLGMCFREIGTSPQVLQSEGSFQRVQRSLNHCDSKDGGFRNQRLNTLQRTSKNDMQWLSKVPPPAPEKPTTNPRPQKTPSFSKKRCYGEYTSSATAS